MRKVLIVDDDHLVRSYLNILPSWERAGFQIEAGARDGEEALSILENTEIDLLMTDISMPLLDGIELIRRVRRTNRQVYIIALSCHDEFTYVKDALKEGADDYVLKNTLNEDSLYRLLEAAAQRMEERQRQQEEQIHIRHLAKAGDHQLKYAYFSKVIGESIDPREEERERLRAGLRHPYRNCGAVCMRLESWEGEDGSAPHPGRRRYCQEFLRRLPEAADQLADGGGRLAVVYWGKGVFYGFLDLSDLREDHLMRQRLMDAALCCHRICGQEPYPYAVGVSGPCLGGDAVQTAYRQVNELMKLRFYERREILYYDAEKKAGTQVPEEARALLARAEEYRYLGDRESFLEACMKAAGQFERKLVDERLVRLWLQELELKVGISPEEGEKRLVGMEQVYRRLERDAKRLYQGRAGRIPEKVSRPVSTAAAFVQDHYKEPVGLTEAAQAAGVNPTYLSYLFRKEMGIGFSNYLLNRRIECAMALLRETNMKVREAAEQSGFHDYHYFAKAFKKINGLSPAEYRKQAE